jgi:predicted RNase H-like HicB family nuclease
MNDRYTYRVTWSEEDAEYVGLCAEFPGLSWLAGTPEDALAGIRATVAEVVADMNARGETVPEPVATRHFQRQVHVRVPLNFTAGSRWRLPKRARQSEPAGQLKLSR